jgi:nitroreductase
VDAIKCIKTRRSIRKFQDKDVPEDVIKDIIDCARNAPSANNTQSWNFIVVKDKAKRRELSTAQPWAKFIADAPVCIVVCCDKNETSLMPAKYLNSTCAAQNIMLSAHAYDLGSCWCYVKDLDDPSIEGRVKDILKIPEDVEVLCMIPVGYPDENPTPKIVKEYEEILHKEEWKI